MYKLLTTLMLVAPLAFIPTASATQTCDPAAQLVCTGDSGDDEFAGCDGVWADVWTFNLFYAQVCNGYDGTTHVWVCPLGGDVGHPNCEHANYP